jgi:hAT family C-terminal dimerisation region
MASSISSERAFSQGGITISKCCNRLKGDIVEALQCIKCAIRYDLLFRETGPSSLDEDNIDEYEVEDDPGEQPEEDGVEEEGWDHLFLEEDEDNLQSDIDMDQEN